MAFGRAAVPVICILGTRIGIIVERLGIDSRGIEIFAIMGQPTIDEWVEWVAESLFVADFPALLPLNRRRRPACRRGKILRESDSKPSDCRRRTDAGFRNSNAC